MSIVEAIFRDRLLFTIQGAIDYAAEKCRRLGVSGGNLDFLEEEDVGPFPALQISP